MKHLQYIWWNESYYFESDGEYPSVPYQDFNPEVTEVFKEFSFRMICKLWDYIKDFMMLKYTLVLLETGMYGLGSIM